MLETQRYLRAGGTLDDLAARYFIKSRVSADLGVVCLNYSQGISPMGERICQECRSLILELGTWDVVSRSFFKFFNHGQPGAAEVDWSTARVQEKLDGSLIMLYHWRDAWRFASRSVADASGAVNDSKTTFRQLAIRALADMGLTLDTLTDGASRSHCFSFELTTPENRVIVEQRSRRLTLIGAWDRDTLRELGPADVALPGMDWVRQYDLLARDGGALRELAATFDPTEMEGYVVVDGAFERIKIKNPLYVAATSFMGGLVTTKQQLTLVLDPAFDDVVPLLTPSSRERLEKVEQGLAQMMSAIMVDYQSIAHLETQREFAAEAIKRSYSKVLFDLRKGGDVDECVRRINIDSLVSWYDDHTNAESTSAYVNA